MSPTHAQTLNQMRLNLHLAMIRHNAGSVHNSVVVWTLVITASLLALATCGALLNLSASRLHVPAAAKVRGMVTPAGRPHIAFPEAIAA